MRGGNVFTLIEDDDLRDELVVALLGVLTRANTLVASFVRGVRAKRAVCLAPAAERFLAITLGNTVRTERWRRRAGRRQLTLFWERRHSSQACLVRARLGLSERCPEAEERAEAKLREEFWAAMVERGCTGRSS